MSTRFFEEKADIAPYVGRRAFSFARSLPEVFDAGVRLIWRKAGADPVF